MFGSIETETGWRLSFLNDVFKKKWGWNNEVNSLGS